MVCGTASHVGKSRIVAGLCRLLARRGVRVAPFKAQNMSLNATVTADGAEIGRSQAAQAMAAGVEPEAAMNPILLKPTGPDVNQVVVMGRAQGHMTFAGYRGHVAALRAAVRVALDDLRTRFDVVVCEGAGGVAEINLLDGDLVNAPLARDAGVPVIVVGDVERGGVFAALHGSVDLLPGPERAAVRGFVVNKMRGDASLLAPGLAELERRHGVATLGVVPWIDGLAYDEEDSLALAQRWGTVPAGGRRPVLDVAVVRLPHIANYTDLDPLDAEPDVTVRAVTSGDWGDPDLVVVPGTKATVADLQWTRARGIADALCDAARRPDGPVVLGLCGGLQMLGEGIDDAVESGTGTCRGLGLLELETTFEATKVTRRRTGHAQGAAVGGYQIHHGRVRRRPGAAAWLELDDDDGREAEGCRSADGRVLGTTVHGLFEHDAFRGAFLGAVARQRGRCRAPSSLDFEALRIAQCDTVADVLAAHLDLEMLEAIIGEGILGRAPDRVPGAEGRR